MNYIFESSHVFFTLVTEIVIILLGIPNEKKVGKIFGIPMSYLEVSI